MRKETCLSPLPPIPLPLHSSSPSPSLAPDSKVEVKRSRRRRMVKVFLSFDSRNLRSATIKHFYPSLTTGRNKLERFWPSLILSKERSLPKERGSRVGYELTLKYKMIAKHQRTSLFSQTVGEEAMTLGAHTVNLDYYLRARLEPTCAFITPVSVLPTNIRLGLDMFCIYKHTSRLQYSNNYFHKMFYRPGSLWLIS
jgi:hypothetical protein